MACRLPRACGGNVTAGIAAEPRLDVTVVIFANGAYRILGIEMGRTGGGEPGSKASRLLDLGDRRPTREAKIAFLQDRARRRTSRAKGLSERCKAA